MDNNVKENDSTVIDVIEEFDFSTQKSDYSDSFKTWRSNKENPHAFNFRLNTRERVYNDSSGFQNPTIADAEKKSITSIMQAVGVAMFIFIFIDNFAGKAIAAIMNIMGMNVRPFFFDGSYYGGSREIMTIFIAATFIELFAPILFLARRFRMPIKLQFLNSIKHSYEIVGSIGLTLILCTAICIPSAYSSETKDIYTYFRDLNADVSVWDQKEFMIFIMFDIIISSILYEMIVHGAIFTALRQFGDVFAIIVTTVISCLLTRDFLEMPAAIMISIAAGLGTLRSGTIFTAFSVQIIYKTYRLALIVLQSDPSGDMFIIRNASMMILLIFGVILYTAAYVLRNRKNEKSIAAYSSEQSVFKRLYYAAKSFPFPAASGICLLEALIKLLF